MTANRLLLVVGVLIAGEVCGFLLGAFASIWPWLAAGGGVSLLAAYGWGLGRLLLPTVFAAGMVAAARTEDARCRILDSCRYVSQPPSVVVRVESPARPCRTNKRAGRRVDFLSHIGPISARVVLPLREGMPTPAVGETWRCAGRLSCKHEDSNRFSLHTFWITGAACRIGQASAAVTWRMALRQLLGRQVAIGLDWSGEVATLNSAILLGQRAGLSPERRKVFADAGTLHVFAISGLHVMLIAITVGGLLARLDVPLRARQLVVLPVVVAYVTLVGLRPSAVRAALMLALYILAPFFGRRPNARTAWSLTALIVYGLSPERLFDLGCLLSFAVMLGIVLWVEWWHGMSIAANTWWYRLFGVLGVSFAAWVAGVPICAQAFGQFSLGGLLANVLLCVCVGWMVRCGVFGLMASFLCTPLAALANNLSAACTCLMAFVSEHVASMPFAVVATPRWTWLHGVSWYAAWLAVCFLVHRLRARRRNNLQWM